MRSEGPTGTAISEGIKGRKIKGINGLSRTIQKRVNEIHTAVIFADADKIERWQKWRASRIMRRWGLFRGQSLALITPRYAIKS